MRRAVSRGMRSGHQPIPAPTRGWITNENMAAAAPGSARIMENWFPEAENVRMRGGRQLHATLSASVESIFSYETGATSKMFAGDETKIYDVTSPADPEVAPTAAVTGQTSGEYVVAQLAVSGTEYLVAVNGADDPQTFDGTTWAVLNGGSTPSLSGSGLTVSTLSYAWNFKSRLFFIEAATLSVWYLPVDSIGGTATELNLSGVFQKGGALYFGATWSSDSGDGFDDRCIFVTDQGEMAVYEGYDPSGGVSTWSLVGVYEIGDPLGPKAHIRAGGDVVIATKEGFVPVSEAVRRDTSALSIAAVSRNIETEWKQETVQRTGLPWEAIKWDAGNYVIIGMPVTTVSDITPAQCFVANSETGAWTLYTGWNAAHFGTRADKLYLSVGAEIFLAETSGLDDEDSYTCRFALNIDHFGAPGVYKVPQMVRGSFIAGTEFTPKFSLAVNYSTDFPSAPGAATVSSGAVWDTSLWDSAVWGGGAAEAQTLRWNSVSGAGHAHSVQAQVTSGSTIAPSVRLIAMDVTYEAGGVVV